ncbi:SidA/IucD/PvdA family monooxygenase [Kitasatospora kazusensis]|uniref:L-lysine N6-monooxygenase MbtG n=1 Tax=Kitasatospora kazusensis TaxID=407974 RepID=A0ABP5LEI8_9ACTN
MTNDLRPRTEPLDLLGVGVGPFNLSLAALADQVPGLRAEFLERAQDFPWRPGPTPDGGTLQVPFLADLVSPVDPSSPWSFPGYLRASKRLLPSSFAERLHIQSTEYDAYCRWVSHGLPQCRFGHRVDSVCWDEPRQAFAVDYTYEHATGGEVVAGRAHARNLVLGIGTEPAVPAALRHLLADNGATALHAADYLSRRDELLGKRHVTVVGSGRSGAEVFLDLLRARPTGREGLHWITRSPSFGPTEYSGPGPQQLIPDRTRLFHRLPGQNRDGLPPQQGQLQEGTSAETIGTIHDELYRRTVAGGRPDAALRAATAIRTGRVRDGRIDLEIEHARQGRTETLTTDAVVLATGRTERRSDNLLHGLAPYVVRDRSGRALVDADHRLALDGPARGSVFVTHGSGFGAPNLGTAAWRSATILNALTGRDIHHLPTRPAFPTPGGTHDTPAPAPGTTRPPTSWAALR